MSFDHVRCAEPHYQSETYGSKNVNERSHARLIADTFEIRSQAALTLRLEAIVLLLFLGQSLNNSDGCKSLLSQRSQESCAHTCLARGNFDAMRVTKDRPKQERRHHECNNSKLPTKPENHANHATTQTGV